MSTQKMLYVLRHAKAEHGSAQQDDHERGIIDVGIEAAEKMGEYLEKERVTADLVLCSTAIRAKMTWDTVCRTFHGAKNVQYIDRLYLASMNELLGQLQKLDEKVQRVFIIGHNPGLHQLCLKLAKSGSEHLLDTLAIKFPTTAFAALELGDTLWKEAEHMHGELKDFVTPSMFGQESD